MNTTNRTNSNNCNQFFIDALIEVLPEFQDSIEAQSKNKAEEAIITISLGAVNVSYTKAEYLKPHQIRSIILTNIDKKLTEKVDIDYTSFDKNKFLKKFNKLK